jgi:hypothetical protein
VRSCSRITWAGLRPPAVLVRSVAGAFTCGWRTG